MENEIQQSLAVTIDQLTARLNAAVELLERAVPHISAVASETIGPIVATIETSRESELSQRLAEAEKTLAELRASATSHEGRKTLPVSLLAKHDGSAVDTNALDAALISLSLEQRIAVKSQLMRAGLV